MHLKYAFWISLTIAAVAWVWEYLQLIKKDLPNDVYAQMFKQNVWIGFIILGGMIAGSF